MKPLPTQIEPFLDVVQANMLKCNRENKAAMLLMIGGSFFILLALLGFLTRHTKDVELALTSTLGLCAIGVFCLFTLVCMFYHRRYKENMEHIMSTAIDRLGEPRRATMDMLPYDLKKRVQELFALEAKFVHMWSNEEGNATLYQLHQPDSELNSIVTVVYDTRENQLYIWDPEHHARTPRQDEISCLISLKLAICEQTATA